MALQVFKDPTNLDSIIRHKRIIQTMDISEFDLDQIKIILFGFINFGSR